VRVKNKAWFFGGAALGLAIPLGMRVYERVLMLGHVRPVALWLFWPTSLFMNFRQSYTVTSDVLLFSLMILCNALLYGLLASVLRRASIGVAALLLIVVWVFLPPSDSALVSRFGDHRDELQRLVQMANSDAQVVQIGPSVVKTVDGREYGVSEAQSVLSQARWAEYRRLFQAAGLNDGLYRSPTTGDVFLSAHTLDKIDPVGSYFGYLYCPAINGRLSGSVPCMEGRESVDTGAYRWKKLDSDWYIYEVFSGRTIEQAGGLPFRRE